VSTGRAIVGAPIALALLLYLLIDVLKATSKSMSINDRTNEGCGVFPRCVPASINASLNV